MGAARTPTAHWTSTASSTRTRSSAGPAGPSSREIQLITGRRRPTSTRRAVPFATWSTTRSSREATRPAGTRSSWTSLRTSWGSPSDGMSLCSSSISGKTTSRGWWAYRARKSMFGMGMSTSTERSRESRGTLLFKMSSGRRSPIPMWRSGGLTAFRLGRSSRRREPAGRSPNRSTLSGTSP